MDVDYADQLPDAARVWLAAFLEEHYRGYRLRRETQVTRLEHLREADAARKRVSRGEDVMAFRRHLESEASRGRDVMGDDLHAPTRREFALLAGAAGREEHELRARNTEEDRAAEEIDARRARRGR